MEFLDAQGKVDPHVHRHAGRRRAQAAGAGDDDDGLRGVRRNRIRRWPPVCTA